jgi:hypothetical protein
MGPVLGLDEAGRGPGVELVGALSAEEAQGGAPLKWTSSH